MKLNFLNPLVRGSAIVLIGSLAGSFLNYLFHFLVGRFLSPSEYGILMSLFSILYIVGIPGGILGTTATKFASQYKAREDFKAVTAALFWVSKIVSVLGLTLFCLAFLFRNQIAGFLKIPDPRLPVLFFVFVALSFLGSAPLGFLRGLSRFKAFSFISFLGPLLKVLLGAGLAFLGFGVFGVTWGLITSNLLGLVACLVLLRKNLRFPFAESSFSQSDLLKYALPTAVILLALISFYNADVILVKHFFSPEEAGIYSSVVTMGRIIFFGLSSVALVMFPLASEKHENGGDPLKVLKNSLLLVVPGAVVGTLAYFLFPRLLVTVFFGSKYLSAVPYLGTFALFMGLYAVVDLVSQFFLSVRNFRPALFLTAFSLLQIALLCFFHETLFQVIYVNIGTTVGLLSTFAVDYLWSRRYRKK